ncbi:hypothetical protein [Sessilibacter sp. MAH2]
MQIHSTDRDKFLLPKVKFAIEFIQSRLTQSRTDRGPTYKRTIGLLLISFMLHGCDPLIVLEQQTVKPASFTLTYQKYSTSRAPLLLETVDEGLTLWFPAIPGGLVGTPNNQMLAEVVVTQKQFQLDLPESPQDIAKPSSKMNIRPADTALIRVGTFHGFPNSEPGGGGFINKHSGNHLILVYFSKPCVIKGDISTDLHTENLTIAQPGWNWLELVPDELGYQPKVYTGSETNIEMAIYVNNAISL